MKNHLFNIVLHFSLLPFPDLRSTLRATLAISLKDVIPMPGFFEQLKRAFGATKGGYVSIKEKRRGGDDALFRITFERLIQPAIMK
jgi:hypothetical protein